MISRWLDAWLSRLELRRADRFAREQAQIGCVAPGTVVEIEHVPVMLTCEGLTYCTPDFCNAPKPHSPCHYQTALAAQRDAKRGAK